MSTSKSPATEGIYGLQRVCRVLGIARSTIYSVRERRRRKSSNKKRGPASKISDELLLESIRQVINTSPFKGEGHRKICTVP